MSEPGYDSKKSIWGFCGLSKRTELFKHNHILCMCPSCIINDKPLILQEHVQTGFYLCVIAEMYIHPEQIKEKGLDRAH